MRSQLPRSLTGKPLRNEAGSVRGGHEWMQKIMQSSEDEVMHVWDEETLIFTMASGTSEKVISEEVATRYPRRPSVGTERILACTSANRATLANAGDDDNTFQTVEGHNCMVMMPEA